MTVDEVLEDCLQGVDHTQGLPLWEDPLTATVAVPNVIQATSPSRSPCAGSRQNPSPKSGKHRAKLRTPRKAAPRKFNNMVITFDPNQLEQLDDISCDFSLQETAARSPDKKSSSNPKKSPKAPANRRERKNQAPPASCLSPTADRLQSKRSTTPKRSARSPARSSSMDELPFRIDSGEVVQNKRSHNQNEIAFNSRKAYVPVTPSFASKGDRKQATTKKSARTPTKTSGLFEKSFSDIESDILMLQGNSTDNLNSLYPKPEFALSFEIAELDSLNGEAREQRFETPNGTNHGTQPIDEPPQAPKNVRRGVSRTTSYDSYSQSTDHSPMNPTVETTKPPAKSSRSGRRPRNVARRAVRQAVDDGWHVEDFDQPVSALLDSSNDQHRTSNDDGSTNKALLEQEEELIQLALERSLHDSSSFDTRSLNDQSTCSLSLNGCEDGLAGYDFDMTAAINATNDMMKDMLGISGDMFDSNHPDLTWEKHPSDQGRWVITPCLRNATQKSEEEKLIEEATKASVKEALHASLDELCRSTPRVNGAYWAHH